jgi:hypothetical protein
LDLGLGGTYPKAEEIAPKIIKDGSEYDGYTDDWEEGLEGYDYYDMLFHALKSGHIDTAKPIIYILEPGFKPMWMNEKGQNFMHALAMNRELDVHSSYSVKPGRPVESPGYGWTNEQKMLDLYHHLVRERCNIHIRDNNLRSPLFTAAMNNNATVTELLLNDQADPNTWDRERRKALHAAILKGADEPAQLLIGNTYTLAKDGIGCTPMDLATFRRGLVSFSTIQMIGDKMKEDQIMREADGTEVPRSETAVWKHCLYWSRTWNVKRLRYWVEVASVLCMRGEADRKMLDVYIEDVRELAPCVEAALPVLGRGNVGIDFDNCTINIEKDIDFENRKPPDTSAEFKEGTEDDVRLVLEDVATVVKAFKAPMIVEGHTGATDPPDYWQALAQNRAQKICEVMYEFGCTPDQLRPKGCPGGGAYVAVRPAKQKK